MHSTAKFYKEIFENGPPLKEIKGKKYSTDQLKGAFCAIRVPRKEIDEYFIEEKTFQKHSLLLVDNVNYFIKVIDDNNNVIDTNTIASSIKTTITYHKKNKSNQDIGGNFVTAATSRDEAATALNKLLNNKDNINIFDQVKKSIIVVCYDDIKKPKNLLDRCQKAVFNQETYNR